MEQGLFTPPGNIKESSAAESLSMGLSSVMVANVSDFGLNPDCLVFFLPAFPVVGAMRPTRTCVRGAWERTLGR